MFKKIPGYDNYSVNSDGQVRNDKTGHLLKPGTPHSLYITGVYKANPDMSRDFIQANVKTIRELIDQGESMREISKKLGKSRNYLYSIKANRSDLWDFIIEGDIENE